MPVSKYDITLDIANNPDSSHALVMGMVGSDKRVLDVGCDTGYLGEQLAAFGNVTSGFEINEASAEVARTRYRRVEVGDLEAVDLAGVFDHEQFDVIVFADVLEHLRDPLPVLRDARSMLAPGGCVVISVPNVAHGDLRLNLLRGRFDYTSVGLLDDTHTRFFTATSLEEFVASAGFVMLELRRARQVLFHTEVEVAREHFDAALVAALEQDLEAMTYQLIVRIVPADAVTPDSAESAEADLLRAGLHRHRVESEHMLDRTSLHDSPAAAAAAAAAEEERAATLRALRHDLLRLTDRALGFETAEKRLRGMVETLHTELAEAKGGLGRRDATVRRAADQIRTLESRVKTVESEIAELRDSRTWRVGKAVVRPAARLSRFIKR